MQLLKIMPDDPEWSFLKALWESIKEGFQTPKAKGKRSTPSQDLASRVGNSVIIVLCLALLVGGTFAGLALLWASRATRVGHSPVTTFFFIGAGLGALVGLGYVIRCWLRDDDL